MNTICIVAGGVLLLAGQLPLTAATTNPADFTQVRELIRANLPEVTEAELNQNALAGLLQAFRGKVRLLDAASSGSAPQTNLAKSMVLDSGVAYLRVENVAAGLATEVTAQYHAMSATNRLKGVVLDLRFAGGDDYAAAAAVADLFVTAEQPLLDWGHGLVKSTSKTNALAGPVAVLINDETTGAPEALAALLRATGTGLLLGNPTRGAAMTAKDFALPNGQLLRIAAAPVKLGDETALPTSGVKPDIQVAVKLADERMFLEDPYALPGKSMTGTNSATAGTNRVTHRVRTTEADLVRARREGLNFDAEQPMQRESETEKPVLRDPALARAVDLLKGLAVVRRAR